MKTTSPARQLAIYLGVEIPDEMPDGEYQSPPYIAPNYRPDRDTEDAEMSAARNNAALLLGARRHMTRDCTPGSAVALIAAELPPLYTAPGERMPDGRTGTDAVLEALVESWPELPDANAYHLVAHDLHTALGRRIWLTQGNDWEYIVPDAKAIYSAFANGAAATDVRAALMVADSPYVSERRAARNGDKA